MIADNGHDKKLTADTERKEPMPPALDGIVIEPHLDSDRTEPTLRALRDDPVERGAEELTVPADWLRRAERRGGAATTIAVVGLALVVLLAGGYVAWPLIQTAPSGKPAAATPTANAPTAAAPQLPQTAARGAGYQVQPSTPARPVAAVPPPPTVAPAPTKQVAVAPPPPAVVNDVAQRARAREAAAEKTRQEAAEKARQEAAEKGRLAAIARHEEKIRAERERKEAARRAAHAQQVKLERARAAQERSVQERLDQAGQAPTAPAPANEDQAAQPEPRLQRHQQNANLSPRGGPGDEPPLDAGDLPPPASVTAPAPADSP